MDDGKILITLANASLAQARTVQAFLEREFAFNKTMMCIGSASAMDDTTRFGIADMMHEAWLRAKQACGQNGTPVGIGFTDGTIEITTGNKCRKFILDASVYVAATRTVPLAFKVESLMCPQHYQKGLDAAGRFHFSALHGYLDDETVLNQIARTTIAVWIETRRTIGCGFQLEFLN